MSFISDNYYYAGVDLGASATKTVIINSNYDIIGSKVVPTTVEPQRCVADCFNEALKVANITKNELRSIIATGYGRHIVKFATGTRTEILCHSIGAYHYYPEAITVVDIGGQDTKIIKLDANGKLISFRMNRKCAAGTGMFIEELAHKLQIPLEELNRLAMSSRQTSALGSYCTVFACTELLARIRAGESTADLIRGAFLSIIYRISELEKLEGKIVMTGGVVAHNKILAELLKSKFNLDVQIPPNAQLIGAFGAAIVGKHDFEEIINKSRL